MTANSCLNEPAVVEFHRRGAGLSLAELGPVAYWLCVLPDVGKVVRVRLVAQWNSKLGSERRAQVGAEWEQVSPEDDVRIARARIAEHHADICGGRIEGRTIQ